MGFRFRRSIKIAPGVKLNIGKKGISSVSIGGKGYTKNISKRGTRTTIGIPGTGISYTNYRKRDNNRYNTAPKESKIERAANKLTELAQNYRECPIDNKQDKIKWPKIVIKEFIITGLLLISCIFLFPMIVFAFISAVICLFTMLFNKQYWAQMYQSYAIRSYHLGEIEKCIHYCEKSLKKKEYESTRRLLDLAMQG